MDRNRFKRLKDENSALLREDIARGAVRYRAMPEVVTLNHTDLCNLKCRMCPRSRKQGRHRLPKKVLAYVMNELFPTARKTVLTTSGGEPLMVDFDFIVEHALHYGVKIDVVTNGVLLTPERYGQARGAFDHLNVSFDCHVPEVYERIRCGSSFRRMEENLKGIRDLRALEKDDVIYSLSAVVMRSNLPHLSDFVRFAAEMGVDGVVFQSMKTYLNPTPEESPERKFSSMEIRDVFERAMGAAQETGINLYLSEFGLPGVQARPLRPKIPVPLEGQGLCWFIAQNFGIMYTGDVYPCCIVNDHCWGNVLYQNPSDIWNGPVARKLRAAHLDGTGTLFCNGCINAPHLRAPKSTPIRRKARMTRMILRHFRNKAYRGHEAAFLGTPSSIRRGPTSSRKTARFSPDPAKAEVRPFLPSVDALTRNPEDCTLWYVREGMLREIADLSAKPGRGRVAGGSESVSDRPAAGATALYFVGPRVALVGFMEDGKLLRVDARKKRSEVSTALYLSDARSFGATGESGEGCRRILLGSANTAPFRGRDARNPSIAARTTGDDFVEVKHFPSAKHIHNLLAEARGDRLFVTFGDLAGEGGDCSWGKRGGRRFRDGAEGPGPGYTASAETEGFVHFGTDLAEGNGIVRIAKHHGERPEFRSFPEGLDLQVRQLRALGPRTAARLDEHGHHDHPRSAKGATGEPAAVPGRGRRLDGDPSLRGRLVRRARGDRGGRRRSPDPWSPFSPRRAAF